MQRRRSATATRRARRATATRTPGGGALSAQYCPLCQSNRVLPIVYGLPGPELLESAREGRVHLGGCVVYRENPEWHCRKCGYEWGGAGNPA
jgi:hypothetical protein